MNYELLKKYNVPGPRYTSYPTVPYWTDSPTEQEWITAIANSLEKSIPQGIGAAMYLHIPFCESLCTYCGCNTRITRNRSVGVPYIESVLQEWKLYQEKFRQRGFHSKIPVSEFHLGGGTPTFLPPEELSHLLESLFSQIELTKDHELSIEADPRVTTDEHLKALARFGFTRLSLGIQDFDPKVQEVVHRVQSFEQVKTVCDGARALGFTSINFDLIYGLPFQTLRSVEDTIEKVRDLRPDRIAFYAYAHVPWIKPSQRRFTEADLPNGEAKRKLYERGRQMLEEAGYIEIGMDHFALKTDTLYQAVKEKTLHRNFMGYTAKFVAPLIGLGVSSIGDSGDCFAQNEKQLEVYQARVKKGEIPIHRGHLLTEEDVVIRNHILNLMTSFSTSWEKNEMSTEYLNSVQEKLAEFERDGLCKLEDRKCTITEEGRGYIRNICMAFDARLSRKAPDTQLFSKTV